MLHTINSTVFTGEGRHLHGDGGYGHPQEGTRSLLQDYILSERDKCPQVILLLGVT